jgi:two-component system chemotaxis response regulator CheB
MVVDDSAVVRGVIGRLIEAAPGMTVTASAASAAMALNVLQRQHIDVVVLDIEMPEMDGITALPLLLAAQPGLKVVIASSLSRRNAEISLRALQLGAADYLPKPDGSIVNAEDFNRELVGKIRALGRAAGAAPRPAPAAAHASAQPTRWTRPVRPTVVAIGGSTGAPPVLISLFQRLQSRIVQPIFITQHMPATFTQILAEQIKRVSGRPAAEAVDGEPVAEGRIYVAPGGWHMTVMREGGAAVIRLNQEPPEHFCRPAVDPMLCSLAQVYGPGVLACILTGMGSDGAKGCEVVAASGGRFIVQDEATSAVWGMPGAAAKTGLASQVLPADQIASALAQMAEGGAQ